MFQVDLLYLIVGPVRKILPIFRLPFKTSNGKDLVLYQRFRGFHREN